MLLEREFSDPRLMPIHRLTVDTWAVQHPGDGSRRAIQSVGLHLARLWLQLEDGLSDNSSNAAMLEFAERKAELPELRSRERYQITVAEVIADLSEDNHEALVRRWAKATWDDWADQHDFIKPWARAGKG